jgi:excinuclease UvrABC ATPase subunit
MSDLLCRRLLRHALKKEALASVAHARRTHEHARIARRRSEPRRTLTDPGNGQSPANEIARQKNRKSKVKLPGYSHRRRRPHDRRRRQGLLRKRSASAKRAQKIAEPIVREISARLGFMFDVGLAYLTLDRKTGTLSGGEAQRIRLATQVGSGLVGVCYVLDEPTIGLHQRDNTRLIRTLHRLRDIGNTVIMVEHDEDCIRAADYLIDIGPGAGAHGGNVVVTGIVRTC